MRRMLLLVILLSLLSTSVAQNIEDVADSDVLISNEREAFLSNETIEQNPEKEYDVELITTEDGSEVEREEDPDEVVKGADGTCGSPPAVRHANIDGGRRTSYEVGTELKYSCEFGYSTDSANHISRCLREGDKTTWTDPGIICIPKSCGDPGFVLNGQRIGSRFTFPNQVSFECDDGYELKGSGGPVRYCQVNGRWSGSLPSCEKIFCDQPPHPENGRVSYASLEYGSQLKYDCEKGFILKNHQTRVCSENGTWNGPEPLCLDAQCDQPSAPEHGSVEVVGGNPRVGSIAIFKCENDRTMVGSATSKCLEIGEWTFPAPKCVEPCIVPNVEHGRIGRYEKKRWNRQKVLTQLSVGTPLKDVEELHLRCDDLYEPLGKNKQEEKVTCEKGQWIETPTCEPARCRSKPPDMQNGRAGNINREHGNYVVYFCAKNFKKTKRGNVTCHFGNWRGIPPTCSDTRCYVDRIPFPGIIKKGRKNVYNHREEFRFDCEKGYDVNIETEKKLVCEEGTWKGLFPPCKAASCLTSPPLIKNGRIKSYSEMHSSQASYECEEHYILHQSTPGVQCLFGEWTGTPPACKEGRCYFQNLKYKKGLVAPSKDPVDNGENIEVKCASGYTALFNLRPLCSNGQWTEFETSPCKPNNCLVEQINNGAFTDRHSKQVWKWTYHATEYEFRLVRIGVAVSAGVGLYVTCNYRYAFQGGDSIDAPVVCSEGRWKPTPVCLPHGTPYKENNEMDVTSNLAARTSNKPKSFATSPDGQPPAVVESISTASDFESTDAPKAEECYCLYQGHDDLVAYSGHQLLGAGSRVKANASVKFYCMHFGYHHFMGPREIVCNRCKPWHSSEYPSCVVPVRGDVVIQIDKEQKILPGGILTMDQGVEARFICISNNIADYPIWSSTVASGQLRTVHGYDLSSGQAVYSNILLIHNVNARHTGNYSCHLPGKRAREIRICIRTKCKKFDESEEFHIYYDNRQEVNSSVIFKCKDSDRKLGGPHQLTCLSNGEWSGQPPTCVPKGCPKLAESNNMLTTYSQELAVGSTATFHCFLPGVRVGNSFIKCLPNGEWSGTVPYCTMPRCPLEKLFDHVSENVVPRMEDVHEETLPLGFELHLTCEGDLRLTEPAMAKCGTDGTWVVPKVSCIPGCSPIQVPPGSSLIVMPERDSYRFGEYVSLNCHPGHVLSAEVEIVMCLRNGWSESTIPTCNPSMTAKEEMP